RRAAGRRGRMGCADARRVSSEERLGPRPGRELERAARGPLEMRPVPFAGAVVHPFEADVQLVATQALGERRDRKPAPSVMTHGLRDHVDLRPLWEEWPPERKPGEVVEEVAEHRAAP